MIPISTSIKLVVALVFAIGILSERKASGFEFERDVDRDNVCQIEVVAAAAAAAAAAGNPDVCTSNATMWYSCPVSCAGWLGNDRGTVAEEIDNPDAFYDLHAQTNTGYKMSLEDNEGYVTMYAVIPMLPGMTRYYTEAIEHIAKFYKYTLVAMILPYCGTTKEQNKDDDDDIDDDIDDDNGSESNAILRSIVESRNSDTATKSILLHRHDAQTDGPVPQVLEYLLTRNPIYGSLAPLFHDDPLENDMILLRTRPNIFLVDHTGMVIERMVCPDIHTLKKRIRVHELAMDYEL